MPTRRDPYLSHAVSIVVVVVFVVVAVAVVAVEYSSFER